MISIRKAGDKDLVAINQAVESAIMSWKLPDRVKRLSLSSYFYTEVDLQHFSIFIAEVDSKIVAIAALDESEPADLPGNKQGNLLHGIYVMPEKQHQRIGKQLLNIAEARVIQNGYQGLLVKAQKDATGFFLKNSYTLVEVEDPGRDYANQYYKILT